MKKIKRIFKVVANKENQTISIKLAYSTNGLFVESLIFILYFDEIPNLLIMWYEIYNGSKIMLNKRLVKKCINFVRSFCSFLSAV